MKIRIVIPRRVATAWDSYYEWINVPIWHRTMWAHHFELRRIDIVVVFFFFVCVGWYGYTGGWQGAVLGGATYIMMMMLSLWLL